MTQEEQVLNGLGAAEVKRREGVGNASSFKGTGNRVPHHEGEQTLNASGYGGSRGVIIAPSNLSVLWR